jgi:uncharacterized membrane protein
MRFEASIEVGAPAQRIFDVYTDVERWPEWTDSVTSVQLLDTGQLRVGSRARIKQPRLPTAEWEVVDLVPGRSFSWTARGPGIRTTGHHLITGGDGPVTVTAALEQTGPLGPLIGFLTKGLTERYLQMEVRGLKTRCEA